MKYYVCSKCGKFIELNNLNILESGKDMSFYWCNDCVTKHLNTSEVKK